MELFDDEVEKLLLDDAREKKRTGRGVFHRATRIGTIRGGVRTPVDLLKGKAKKDYMKNGEVKVSYMILKYNDFKLLDENGKRECLSKLLQQHSRAEIFTAWGVSRGTVDNYASKLGLAKRKHNPRKEIAIQAENTEVEVMKEDVVVKTLGLNGKFDGKEAKESLSGLELMLNESKKYIIEINIKEMEREA